LVDISEARLDEKGQFIPAHWLEFQLKQKTMEKAGS